MNSILYPNSGESLVFIELKTTIALDKTQTVEQDTDLVAVNYNAPFRKISNSAQCGRFALIFFCVF